MKKMTLLFSFIFYSFLFINAQNKGYNIGDRVTDFKLENVDNKMMSLSTFFNAKGFIIVFTSNSCPYGLAAIREMNRLNDQYLPLGYPLIAINSNDPNINVEDGLDEMKKQSWRNNNRFPYLKDANKEVASQFGATKNPQVYVIERTPNGYVLRYSGAIDNNTEVDVSSSVYNNTYNDNKNYDSQNYRGYDNYDNYNNYNESNYYNDKATTESNNAINIKNNQNYSNYKNDSNDNNYKNNTKSGTNYVEDVVDNLVARTPQFIQTSYTTPVGCDIK